jgi:hypothetical protein
MPKSHHVGLLLAAAVAATILGGVRFLCFPRWRSPPASRYELPEVVPGKPTVPLERGKYPVGCHEHIGRTLTSIVEAYGPPSVQREGYYGPPHDAKYRRSYDPAQTPLYEGPSGTLYLSFCMVKGQWVCFSSDWMPKGWVW